MHQSASTDHPRRCGENPPSKSTAVRQTGSPPQVRGKPAVILKLPLRPRITPAGAGKTSRTPRISGGSGDHPRRCGENSAAKHLTSAGTGSPPQVRGKRGRRGISARSKRITPAGAGKTRCWAASRVSLRDHPRRCGENGQRQQTHHYVEGSPPQVRGKPRILHTRLQPTGITPAGAGKTLTQAAILFLLRQGTKSVMIITFGMKRLCLQRAFSSP